MPRLTIVFGLPGSGKSSYIKNNEEDYSGVKVEDYYKDSISDPPDRESRHYKELVEQLSKNNDCIIADIVFCLKRERKKFLAKMLSEGIEDLEIDWVYYENDLEKCLYNIEKRERDIFEYEKKIARGLSKKFSIPANAQKQRVWISNL